MRRARVAFEGGGRAVRRLVQAGTWFTEFSDPANPVTLGGRTRWRLTPPDHGGSWPVGWYSHFLHESDITTGLNPF